MGKLNNVQRLKPYVSRRNSSLTSMSLKLRLTMPIRLMLKAKKPSSVTKAVFVILFKDMRNKPVVVKRLWKLLALLNVRQMLSVGRLKSLGALLDSALADARNAVNEMQVINSKAMPDKRGLESVIHTLQAEIDDALQQAKNSEEKSKRAMVDAARLADELR